jgi:NADH:ubiquinone oxidoreductase subunit C
MNRDQILDDVRRKLGGKALQVVEKSPLRVYVDVQPGDVPEATRLLFRGLGARLQIATGVDTPAAIEILYHWAFDRQGFVLTVRTHLDRQNPEIESVANICKGAEWIEREIWELLGVRFRNHPDLRHLLLSDDWPEGKYPLRRDYQK